MDDYDEPLFDSDMLIDPELDIRSERFNPLKALYSPDIPVSIENAKIYDNISQFESNVIKKKTSNHLVSVIFKFYAIRVSSIICILFISFGFGFFFLNFLSSIHYIYHKCRIRIKIIV